MFNRKSKSNNQQTQKDSIFPPIKSIAPMPKVSPPKKEQSAQPSQKNH